MQKRTQYVVDTTSLSADDHVVVCRSVLTAAAHELTSFETDVPWSMADGWPADVRAAAELLSSVGKRRRGDDSYRMSGVQSANDAALWSAFVAFAPYAFDASAWGAEARPIVTLADCASSIVVRLLPAQVRALTAAVSPARLTT